MDVYKPYQENGTNVPIADAAAMPNALGMIMYPLRIPDNADPLEVAKPKPDEAVVFSVLSPHLEDIPPTWIATCGKDPLHCDGIVLGC